MSTATQPSTAISKNDNLSPPMSRRELYIKTLIMRFFQTIGRWCDLYLSPPLPSSPSFTIKITSTISPTPGTIPLLFYTPKAYDLQRRKLFSKRARSSSSQEALDSPPAKKWPVVINFHGGGYTIGHPKDDARFAQHITSHPTTPCVFISVGYRLAPSHPFPTGIEDSVSAILYISSHAEEFNLDTSRIALSGFSAGAQFCFTASYLLHTELQTLKSQGKPLPVIGKIKSLVTFYPPTDWTKSRAERASSNPNFKPIIDVPGGFGSVMEQAYLFPKPAKEEMGGCLLSPGLASDQMVREALPEKLVMVTCWGDGLLGEGEVFRERLKGLGKVVDGYTVPGVVHGWDKWPSWREGNPSRDEAYARAVGWLVEHLGSDDE